MDESDRSESRQPDSDAAATPAPDAPPAPDQPDEAPAEETSDEAPASDAPAPRSGPVSAPPAPADQPGVWPGEDVGYKAPEGGLSPAIRSGERVNRRDPRDRMQDRRDQRAEQEEAASEE